MERVYCHGNKFSLGSQNSIRVEQICETSKGTFSGRLNTSITDGNVHRAEALIQADCRIHVGDRHSITYYELQQTVFISLHNLDADFLYAGFNTLVYGLSKYFDIHGDFVKKLYVPVPYSVLCLFEFMKMFLSQRAVYLTF